MDTQGHILVVDDDREIRMLVGDYLKKHGYRISLATTWKVIDFAG